MHPLQLTIEQLEALLEPTAERLAAMTEEQAARQPAPGQWSIKQVLGHMIDSASNNHHKFVRTMLAEESRFPGYDQEPWVRVQRYQQEPWAQMVALWSVLNQHLLHLMRNVDERALGHTCAIGADAPVSLRFIMEDYLRHLRGHLEQLFS